MGGKWGTSWNTVASMTLWLNPHRSCSLRHHASTQWVKCDNQLSKFSTRVQMCFRHLQTTGDNSLSALVMLQLECLTLDQTCTSPVKCCMLINRRDRSEGVKLTWLWSPQTDVIWDQVRNQILQNFHENLKTLLDCKFKDVQSSKQSFGRRWEMIFTQSLNSDIRGCGEAAILWLLGAPEPSPRQEIRDELIELIELRSFRTWRCDECVGDYCDRWVKTLNIKCLLARNPKTLPDLPM